MVDAALLGRRIAEARQRAGLTQQALATAVVLDRSALAKIERGDRRVSALELSRIADAVASRIEWFVEEPTPAIVSHRNMVAPGEPSPGIDKEVERRAAAVEFVADLDPRFSLADIQPAPFPEAVEQAEALAGRARTLLGAAAEGPLSSLAEHVVRAGLMPFVVDLGADSADAASVLLPSGAVAIVNGSLQVGRRRLALAHELGHVLVADEYTVDWRVDVGTRPDHGEGMLDRFARALLLPRQSLLADWERWSAGSFRTATVRTASKYRVDMATLARRLSDLDVIDQAAAARIRSIRTTRADIVELDLVVGEELSPESPLPREYAAAVLRLYKSETVSEARALDLLFGTWDASDLPSLPRPPESAIWQYVS